MGAWWSDPAVPNEEQNSPCPRANKIVLRLFQPLCVFLTVKNDIPDVCTTQALAQTRADALLVDLREPQEVQALAFDAPEVFKLPMSQLAQRWQALPRDRELILACRTGEQSVTVSHFLQARGYTRVSPMRGGILLWMQKGYPVLGRRFDPADGQLADSFSLSMHKE